MGGEGEEIVCGGVGGTQLVHGRCRMTIDPRIPRNGNNIMDACPG